MKGFVFTELLEVVENTWSIHRVSDFILDAELCTQGPYTPVGAYNFAKKIDLHKARSNRIVEFKKALLRVNFYLTNRFQQKNPTSFWGYADIFKWFAVLNNPIQVEETKPHTDATPPTFAPQQPNNSSLRPTNEPPHNLGKQILRIIVACKKHHAKYWQIASQAHKANKKIFCITRHG